MLRCLLILLITFAGGPAAFGQTVERNLFHIKRNKNLDEILYDGRTVNCKWETSDPLHVHWLDGDKLNLIQQQKAYGAKVHQVSPRELRFRVVSMREVELVATLSEKSGRCVATTRTSINGRPFTLVAVYVHATERSLIPIPKVNYLTFYGCNNGVPVIERVVRSPLSKDELSRAETNERKRIGLNSLCRPGGE